MTPERWHQVEEICHACLALPTEERADFLTRACGPDVNLRREVESLLVHESKAAAFLDASAVAQARRDALTTSLENLIGERLGPYIVQSLLGIGGMGDVYRAHDVTLDRDVAIKVLPAAFSTDADRRARFEREARILAALNHPHIGSIYGIEEWGRGRALILELVEGDTLADRIARATSAAHPGGSTLPLADALAIARQIADALDAAHEKGIVHRDLKPANIKITRDGVVKVLDFGLAKIAPTEDRSPGLTRVDRRILLGTAAYMSPEQARGQHVDKRTDIWAFGCVLYEMLAGRAAFSGETDSDVMARVIERDPDWSALPASTPTHIRRLLVRCLMKDPKQRLRDIADARFALDADTVLPTPLQHIPPPARTVRAWVPWAAAAAVAVGVAACQTLLFEKPQENPLASAVFSRITDWPGTEAGAEISPDGRFVAFVADRDGEFDLFVSQIGTGKFVNLTTDRPALTAPGAILRTFGFTGDGSELWAAAPNDAGGPKTLTPLSGGAFRPFMSNGDAAPSWSSDGTRLAYFRNVAGDPLFIADGSGSEARAIRVSREGEQILFKNGMHNHNPVWSSDGRWIYFVHGSDPTDAMDVWRVRPEGGTPERVTQQNAAVNFLTPLDAHTLLLTARATDRSGPWLWALDTTRHRPPLRVSTGLEVYTSVAASRDGRRLVATVAQPTASLWRVPLLDRLADERDVEPYKVPSVRALAPRFGDTTLFYLSARGTGDRLWRMKDGEALEIWKAPDGALAEPPIVAPDGARVAVVVRQRGARHLLLMAADGTSPKTLAPSLDIQGAAGQSAGAWSPDGAWIAVGARDAAGTGLFKIPVDGGAPVRLVSGQAISPAWSPRGNLIVYGGPLVGGQVPLLGVTPDGTEVKLPDVHVRLGGSHRFLPDGTGVVFLPRNQSLDFWLLDLGTGRTRALTSLADKGRLTTFDFTPDGRALVFDRSNDNSDVVLIERPDASD